MLVPGSVLGRSRILWEKDGESRTVSVENHLDVARVVKGIEDFLLKKLESNAIEPKFSPM